MKFLKNIIKLLCLVCTLAMMYTFVSCNNSDTPDETVGEIYRIVTFNSNGGSYVENAKVLDNGYLTRPEDPTLDNYVFRRWEKDGREWLFEAKKVTSDMTLSALWVSAVELFELEPNETDGTLYISGFKKQASFSTLRVPSKINGKTVTGITDDALSNTSVEHAKHIILPNTIVFIGNAAFKNSTEVTFDIRGTIISIGEESFSNCSSLTQIKLGKGITSIPFMCFTNCSSLKTFDIPLGVTKIDENAFEGCTSMTTIVIPDSLTSIEDSAFSGCKSLKTVFYTGTEEQFDSIDIADSNESFTDAKVYFYSENKPANGGSYWHYENGSPRIW